ncbi:MAG: hypothetical protein IIC78_14620 [Chloroflexi bacterium]|nr:hypothetical protein [Chloroflexota bacterium]
MAAPELKSMIVTSQEERRWFIGQLALGLAAHLNVSKPPVPVEELLRNPPAVYISPPEEVMGFSFVWETVLEQPIYVGGRVIVPTISPVDEKRYAVARELLSTISDSDHGEEIGLPLFISAYLWELKDYFARVLLAPDPLVRAFRENGGDFGDFASSFLIPPRIALIRWNEPFTSFWSSSLDSDIPSRST